MISNNFYHWISGLLAALPLWIFKDFPMPNNETKGVYCFLAIALPIFANYCNELRDDHHFWAWLPYKWANEFDWWDIARCIPLAVICCVVWWMIT